MDWRILVLKDPCIEESSNEYPGIKDPGIYGSMDWKIRVSKDPGKDGYMDWKIQVLKDPCVERSRYKRIHVYKDPGIKGSALKTNILRKLFEVSLKVQLSSQ